MQERERRCKMTQGERIARLRKMRNWTQEKLAEQAGIHSAHMSRIEKDKTRPKASTLAMIARALEVSTDELLDRPLEQPALVDAELLRSFHQAQELDVEDKRLVIRIVTALLTRKRVEQVASL